MTYGSMIRRLLPRAIAATTVIMSYLRTPTEVVLARSGQSLPPRTSPHSRCPPAHGDYLFTYSKWQAIGYVGNRQLVLENGFVNPYHVFQRSIMKAVDYAKARGFQATVMEYRDVGDEAGTGEPRGAILTLRAGSREMGHYAVRYVK